MMDSCQRRIHASPMTLVALGLLLLGSVPAAHGAATILVDDDADGTLASLAGDGKCQLREAVEAANTDTTVDACTHDGSTGLDTINFNLAGVAPSSPSVIDLTSPITVTQPVSIDATSDPDWTTTSGPVIEVNGGDNGYDGFVLEVGSDGSAIKGFRLMDFTGTSTDPAAVRVKSDSNFVQSCYIGTDGSNSVSKGNDYGIHVTGSLNTIGGSGPAQGNLISVNGIAGVYVLGTTGSPASDNVIQGNMLGTFPDGTTGGLGNEVAVLIESASTTTVGGTSTGGLCGLANPTGSVCNVITSSNTLTGAGIRIIQTGGGPVPTGNLIEGNYIGLGADGVSTWANYIGVHILAGEGNIIGGILAGQGNTISANSTDGILLNDPTTTALNTTGIYRNKIGLTGSGTGGIGILGSGIRVVGTTGTIVGGTLETLAGNAIGDNGSVATDAGITAVDAVDLQILGNRVGLDVEANALPNTDNGIHIDGGSVTIYGNRISNNPVGILDDDPSTALSNSTQNCITDNTIGYNNVSGSASPRDFTENWWGDATGPFNATSNPTGLGDPVSDNVTFAPFLTVRPLSCDPFAPTLKKPKNNAGILYGKAVKFVWKLPKGLTGVTLYLQISTDPGFGTMVLDDPTGVDVSGLKKYIWEGAPMGKYYWRIRAISPEGFVGLSETRVFYVTILTKPKNLKTLTDTTPVFKWKAYPLAVSYDLKVFTDPCCGSTVIDVPGLTETSYTDELNPLAAGVYHWQVKPDNSADPTPTYSFTIAP